MITSNEVLALVPLSLLAIFYLITDTLTFNRLRTRDNGCPMLTRPQAVTMVTLYPVWIFVVWIETLSTARGNIGVMVAMTAATTVVGRLTTIFIFNDAFELTRQQWFSLGLRFVINGLWRWNNYLVYASGDDGTTIGDDGRATTNVTTR